MKKIILSEGQSLFCEEQTLIRAKVKNGVVFFIYDKKIKKAGIVYYTNTTAATEKRIKNIFRHFKYQASHPEDLEVKIFGGNRQNLVDDRSGHENVEFAFRQIKKYGVSLTSSRVEKEGVIECQFQSDTGEVWILKNDRSSAIAKELHKEKIKVMIVDDATAIREVLKRIIGLSPLFEIVASVPSAKKAIELLPHCKPDVITLDLMMPEMDGVEFLKHLKEKAPPSLIISDLSDATSGPVLSALSLGAFDFLNKSNLLEFVKDPAPFHSLLMAASKAKRHLKIQGERYKGIPLSKNVIENSMIVIGASTGGTEAIKELFVRWPAKMPPILVVQHIPPHFSHTFAQRLDELSAFHVQEVVSGMVIHPGEAYIAQGGAHMIVRPQGEHFRLLTTDDPPRNRFRPSVDVMFESVARYVCGKKFVLAILLTGMGQDGAKGMLALKHSKAFCMAQDEESSVVFGMPKAAIELSAVDRVLSLERLAFEVMLLLEKSEGEKRLVA